MHRPEFAYHLPCNLFRRTAAGEKDWQEMMHNRTPLTMTRFLQVSNPAKMLDEGETLAQFMDDPEGGIYQSTIRGQLVLFVQKMGFEFIFTPEGKELSEMKIHYPVPADAQQIPPVACDFRVGDRVTVTNGNGIELPGKLITGFIPAIDPEFRPDAIAYLDWDCYWFSVKPEDLKLERREALAPAIRTEEAPSP